MLKVILFVTLVQCVAVFGNQQKFKIKNVKTGQVLDAGFTQFVELQDWQGTNNQMWTLEQTQSAGYYYIHNVGNGKVLDACPSTKVLSTWRQYNVSQQKWKLNTDGTSTELQVLYYPNDFLTQGTGKPVLKGSWPYDDSQKWLLVEVA